MFNLFTVLSIKMINLRTSRPKYRLFWDFLGKYRPFFDDFFQVGPYTDFLRKYGPLYKHCLDPTAREPKATTKVDKRPRPVIHEEMSEHDWRFFLSEWQDYTRATGVTGQYLLDELWSCMSADLRRLAFNQGSKEDLDTETKMMERIKGLPVSVLHAAVHTVALHEARQSPGESTKAFAARVRGIATNCNLVKTCECSKTVSFLDETVHHVVLAGLHDSDMQERALSAAILKTITDTASLVEFCSAEESGRKCTPTVAGFRGSTFQRNKHLRDQPVPQVTPPVTSRFDFCGGRPHSSSSRDTRANMVRM